MYRIFSHRLAVVAAVVGSLSVLCGGAASAQKGKTPARHSAASIRITVVPKVGPGADFFGEIAGTVKNAPAGSRVVLFSLGDMFYVQPYANAPFTKIGADGKWSATIHGGHEFVALLVKPGYEPPATTGEMPKVGGKILAAARAKRPE